MGVAVNRTSGLGGHIDFLGLLRLRLARYNVDMEEPDRPDWKSRFFSAFLPRRSRADDVADLSANWRLCFIAEQHTGCDGQCHFSRVFNDIPCADIFGEKFINNDTAQLRIANHDHHWRLGHYAAHFPLDDTKPDVYNLLCMHSVQCS